MPWRGSRIHSPSKMKIDDDHLSLAISYLDDALNRGALWHDLSLEGKTWVLRELTANKRSLADVKRDVKTKFGLTISVGGLSKYHTKLRAYLRDQKEKEATRNMVVERITSARHVSDEVQRVASRSLPGLADSIAAALGEAVLDLMAKRELDLKDLLQLGEALKPFIMAAKASQGERSLLLQEESIKQAATKLHESLKTKREAALDALAAEIKGNTKAEAAFVNLTDALRKTDEALAA